MVMENDFAGPSYRHPCSVPFLWEEKPGTPKKEWKTAESIPPKFVASPAKLSVSVPFKWEEKPGKPLLQFPQPQTYSPSLHPPPASPAFFPTPSTDSPSHSKLNAVSPKRNNPFLSGPVDSDGCADFSYANDAHADGGMLELDLHDFQRLSPDSAPSLLANRLMATRIVSSAVPVHVSTPHGSSSSQTSEEDNHKHDNCDYLGSEAASNSTEDNSAGDSVLEFFFPLFSPDSSFLNKVIHQGKDLAIASPEFLARDNARDNDCSFVVRKTRTLGELIQLSRRISSTRNKVVSIKKQKRAKDFFRARAFKCCISGTSSSTSTG